MSYSRWTNSRFYTYWSTGNLDRDNQIFEVCTVIHFTYKQIKDDINGCLYQVKELDPSASDKDIKQLQGCMESFIKDIEDDPKIIIYESARTCDIFELLKLREEIKVHGYPTTFPNGTVINHIEGIEQALDEAILILKTEHNYLPTLLGKVVTELGLERLERRLQNG